MRAADSLLSEGCNEPAIVQLSIIKSPIMAVAGPIFERACCELGLTIPSKDAAINQVLHHYLESIVSGARAPYDGLLLIMREVYPHFMTERDKKYVGDSRGMEHLIGAYYSYDDLADRPGDCSWEGKRGKEAIAAWEQSVREHARDWLEKYDHVA